MRYVSAVAVVAFLSSIVGACSKRTAPTSSPEPITPYVEPTQKRPTIALESMGVFEGSTIVLAKAGERTLAYIADEDEAAVHTVDVTEQATLARTPLPGRPAQMLLAKDGTLRVALRDQHAVVTLRATDDPASPLEVGERLETAIEPLALAQAGDRLLVLSGWGHSLESLDLASRARVFAVDLAREPRAVIASNDGTRAFVSHAGAGHVSVVDLDRVASNDVKKIDVGMAGWSEFGHRSLSIHRAPIRTPNLLMSGADPLVQEPIRFICGTGMTIPNVTFPARVARQGFALAKLTGKTERVFVPHVDVATGDALVISSGYGGGGEGTEALPSELFDIDVIDVTKAQRTTGPAADVRMERRTGPDACHLPRAAVSDDSRQTLLVSCVGNSKIIEYDARGSVPTAVVRRMYAVPAGALGLALDSARNQLVVWSQFDRSVTFVSRADVPKGQKPKEPIKIDLPRTNNVADQVALGRKLFHTANDPRIAHDGRACASCHPDGRDDGLVWPTPEGPRQTITLAGRVGHAAPFGWRGQHRTLKEHMVHTMKNLKGKGLTDADHEALEAYLVSMNGPPSDARALSEEELHGRYVFNDKAGCAGCHMQKNQFTDREVHDVGSATAVEQ